MNSTFLKTLPALVVLADAGAQSVSQSLSTTVGGQPQMTGGDYTLDAAFDPVGQSVSNSASAVFKVGFAGQITDPRTLQLSAPSLIGEGATASPSATATLDDGTTTLVPPDAIRWDVVDGPINSVTFTGIVRTKPVFHDTPATIMATWLGVSGTHEFTVLNANNDDVEPVAGDGIDDAWQFQYFDTNADGILSPIDALRAAANADPDGDDQDNAFEFLAGYSPADGDSHLEFRIINVANATGTGTVTIELSKVIPTTRYTLLGTSDLASTDPWSILGTPLVGQDKTNFRANHQGGQTHFYRLVLDPAP